LKSTSWAWREEKKLSIWLSGRLQTSIRMGVGEILDRYSKESRISSWLEWLSHSSRPSITIRHGTSKGSLLNVEANGPIKRVENWSRRVRLKINGSLSMIPVTTWRTSGLRQQTWYTIVATSEREWFLVESFAPKKKLASKLPSSAQRSQTLRPIADFPAPAAPVTQAISFLCSSSCIPTIQSTIAWITATRVPGWYFGASKSWPELCKALGATASRSRSNPPASQIHEMHDIDIDDHERTFRTIVNGRIECSSGYDKVRFCWEKGMIRHKNGKRKQRCDICKSN